MGSEMCIRDRFWDMHSLFETSTPPFGYLESSSMQVLDVAKNLWAETDDGPVVTMDAGANVHLLWRADQLDLAKKVTLGFGQQYRIVSCQSIAESLKSE